MRKKMLDLAIVLLGILIVVVIWTGITKTEHPIKKKDGHWTIYVNDELCYAKKNSPMKISLKESQYADREVDFVFVPGSRTGTVLEWYLLEETDNIFTIERSGFAEGNGQNQELRRRLRIGINGEGAGSFKIGYIDSSDVEQVLEIVYES